MTIHIYTSHIADTGILSGPLNFMYSFYYMEYGSFAVVHKLPSAIKKYEQSFLYAKVAFKGFFDRTVLLGESSVFPLIQR